MAESNRKKTSGMSMSVTDDERDLMNELQELTGHVNRKPMIMNLVRKELASIKGQSKGG